MNMSWGLVLAATAAAVISACAGPSGSERATRLADAPSATQPPSNIKLGEVLLADNFDDPEAAQLLRESGESFIHAGYLGGEYLIKVGPEYRWESWYAGNRTPWTAFGGRPVLTT